MPRGIASAKQLSMMQGVVDAYCLAHGMNDVDTRDHVSALTLQLFDQGERTHDDLLTALHAVMEQNGSTGSRQAS
jgi:hypothetical protein